MIDSVRAPRIAVIDDDTGARDAVDGLMRAVGYETHKFSSADEFLAWPGRSEVACIITDIQMPGRSGLDLKAMLADEGCLPPFVFVTGLPREDPRRAAIEASSHPLVPKPTDPEALIRSVEHAVASSGHQPGQI
jgi:FixJ family two-component response regulator